MRAISFASCLGYFCCQLRAYRQRTLHKRSTTCQGQDAIAEQSSTFCNMKVGMTSLIQIDSFFHIWITLLAEAVLALPRGTGWKPHCCLPASSPSVKSTKACAPPPDVATSLPRPFTPMLPVASLTDSMPKSDAPLTFPSPVVPLFPLQSAWAVVLTAILPNNWGCLMVHLQQLQDVSSFCWFFRFEIEAHPPHPLLATNYHCGVKSEWVGCQLFFLPGLLFHIEPLQACFVHKGLCHKHVTNRWEIVSCSSQISEE